MKIAINVSPSGHRHGHRPRTIYDPTATVRALLMLGVWGSGVDTRLGRLRRAIDDHRESGFPTDAIEDAMGHGQDLALRPGTLVAVATHD